jgi:hypothetical protein
MLPRLPKAAFIRNTVRPAKIDISARKPDLCAAKIGTRELGSDEKPGSSARALADPGIQHNLAGRNLASAEREEGLARRRRKLRLQVK